MHKKMKRVFSVIATACIALGLIAGTGTTKALADSVSWNFKNTGFKELGTISSAVTVDGLTLTANSSKTMTVMADSQTVDGTEYPYALSLGGGGSTDYRSVRVPVSGSDTIKVILRSTGNEARTLVIADSNGNQLGTMAAGTSAALSTYSYSGTSGYIYLYSSGSGINLYKIQVDSYGSTTGGGSSTVESSSASWNFKDTDFKNLTTISSNVTVNNLTLVATSAKTMGVISDNQTVDGTEYPYALALGGGGSTSYRAVKLPVSGSDTIKVILRSSGNTARTLVVADSNGNQLGTMTAGTSASLQSYSYSGSSGYLYLYSSGSGINLYKIQVDSKGTVPGGSGSGNSGNTGNGSEGTNTSDGTVVTSYSELVSAISNAEKAGGGKIYVKGSTISCTGQIALSAKNANVVISGVKNSDGTYPVLDFSSFRNNYIGKSTSDAQVGIRISGSNYTISNLIIEKAPDNGIQIKGSSAGNNTISNCIVRYNNDAGLQITGGAYNNTIKFVCSYRNCDVYTLGGNADGFAPKLAAGKGNTFYGCYAWDNSDDGWDSFDKTDGLTYDLSYTWCACWNNGNPDVFTGKYDFDNGAALDTDMLLVELIMKKDSSFASKYAAGNFSLPSSSFIATSAGTVSLSAWTGSSYDGNPNGFKMGSVNTTSACTRTLQYCLAFDHDKKGFDNNNSSVTASMSNCVAFDNGYNYYIQPFTLKSFSNIVSFSGASSDKLPSGYSIASTDSSKQASIRSSVESTKNAIINTCMADKIPGEVYFNIFN